MCHLYVAVGVSILQFQARVRFHYVLNMSKVILIFFVIMHQAPKDVETEPELLPVPPPPEPPSQPAVGQQEACVPS